MKNLKVINERKKENRSYPCTNKIKEIKFMRLAMMNLKKVYDQKPDDDKRNHDDRVRNQKHADRLHIFENVDDEFNVERQNNNQSGTENRADTEQNRYGS